MNNISDKKTIVTGATGFIGRHLVSRLLSSDVDLTIIARDKERALEGMPESVNIIEADLTRDLVDIPPGADIFFHCAGEIKDHNKFYSVNVKATQKLLDECIHKGVKKFIYLSSVGVIGAEKAGYYDELAPCFPRNSYEKSKLEAEKIVLQYSKNRGLDISILRPSIVYGPGKKSEGDSFLSLITAIKNEYFRYAGDNKSIYNIIYVKDVAEALLYLAAESNSSAEKIFHLNDPIEWGSFVREVRSVLGMSGDMLSINKGVAYVAALSGEVLRTFKIKAPFSMSRYKVLTNKTVFNADRIKDNIGFNLPFTNQTGIRETVQNYIDRGLL